MNKFKRGDLVVLRKDITINEVFQHDYRKDVLQLALDLYGMVKRQNLEVTFPGPTYSTVQIEKKPRAYQISNELLTPVPGKEMTVHEIELILGHPVKVVDNHATSEPGR